MFIWGVFYSDLIKINISFKFNSISDVDFHTNPTFEPICNAQEEHFIESDGKESSLILEFNAAAATVQQQSCSRILSAPPNYGFIIRLILPKIRRTIQHSSSHHRTPSLPGTSHDRHERSASKSASGSNGNTVKDKSNTSAIVKDGRRCPLSIVSTYMHIFTGFQFQNIRINILCKIMFHVKPCGEYQTDVD